MSKKVLIIEDEIGTRELLGVTLEYSDCRLLLAENGQQGLALARAERPDLILLDTMMPGESGLDVCQRLKADPDTARIPVIFISAKDHPDDIRAALACGAEGYITKPFSPIELLETVESRLDSDNLWASLGENSWAGAK